MSEATHGKLVEIKGRKSNKAELGQTCGKGHYQARDRKSTGEEGRHHNRLMRKRSMREREDRGIGPYEVHWGAAR
jgi:hypothetical protein